VFAARARSGAGRKYDSAHDCKVSNFMKEKLSK